MSEITTEPGYSADDISVLEGLDAVRKRPGMYIGSTDSSGLNHLVWEIIDNSVDESLAGYAKRIDVTLGADGSVLVEDDGRGIPTGINKQTGLSGVELSLTRLHAGGKFGGNGYKSAGGLHGVGSSVVNALSTRMDAVVYQNNKEHRISFKGGITGVFAGDGPDAKFKAEGGLKSSPDKRPAAVKKERKTGTTIRWWHDKNIFLPDSKLDLEAIYNRARTTAFLMSGLTLAIHDNRVPGAETSEVFHYTGGIADMVEFLAKDEKLIDPIYVDTVNSFKETVPVMDVNGKSTMTELERELEIKAAFRWGNKYDSELRSYVNIVNTPNGGTHVQGFERGLKKAVLEGIKARPRMMKANEAPPTMEDIYEGLTAVVSVGLPEPQFQGQTKNALGTKAVVKLVETAVYNKVSQWMNERKNSAAAKTVLEKVVNASRIRLAQRQQKDVERRKTALKSSSMPAKLVDCSEVGTEHTELLIAEGDSALGTLKAARDSRYQALLPIRGKILNAHKASTKSIFDNKEITDILQVIGAGSGRSFDLEKIRVARVIIAADADIDGAHIACLLITMFAKLARPMIEDGRLYAAVPPLYTLKTKGKNKEIYYLEDDAAKDKLIAELDKKRVAYEPLSRLKGLGEMDANEFWDTTLNPETRTLKQITFEDAAAAEAMLELAMGKEVPARKEWIINNRSILSDDELDLIG